MNNLFLKGFMGVVWGNIVLNAYTGKALAYTTCYDCRLARLSLYQLCGVPSRLKDSKNLHQLSIFGHPKFTV